MASQNPQQHPAPPPPLNDFPPLGAGSPPEQGGMFPRGNGSHRQNMNNNTRSSRNMSGDYRSNAQNPKPIPTAPQNGMNNHGRHGQFNGGVGFEGHRSPPNKSQYQQFHYFTPSSSQLQGAKLTPNLFPDTSHVPCKFFKVGQCQAGRSCPFSHSQEYNKYENTCKYFSRVCFAKKKVACIETNFAFRVIANLDKNARYFMFYRTERL
jgi:hypothetical protein